MASNLTFPCIDMCIVEMKVANIRILGFPQLFILSFDYNNHIFVVWELMPIIIIYCLAAPLAHNNAVACQRSLATRYVYCEFKRLKRTANHRYINVIK